VLAGLLRSYQCNNYIMTPKQTEVAQVVSKQTEVAQVAPKQTEVLQVAPKQVNPSAAKEESLMSTLRFYAKALVFVGTMGTVIHCCNEHEFNPEIESTQVMLAARGVARNFRRVFHLESERDYRNILLSYISNSSFVTDNILEQLTGCPADLVRWDVSEHMLYFTVDRALYESGEAHLDLLAVDPSLIEFPEENNRGQQEFGEGEDRLTYLGTDGNIFFRIHEQNFRVDMERGTTIHFDSIDYDMILTPEDLLDSMNNRRIWKGREFNRDEYQDISSLSIGRRMQIANHGSYVSRPDDPVLTELVDSLSEGLQTKEEIAQRLLDFVYAETRYSFAETRRSSETLKRAYETLMSGESDCSGRTILYSSLLATAGIDNFLVYTDDHIYTVVEGEYPEGQAPRVELEGRTYTVADTTVMGVRYIIGQGPSASIRPVIFYQRPGDVLYRVGNDGEMLAQPGYGDCSTPLLGCH